uniref:Uncharacterized protein n=1 Tax=Oryza brachyantha TaxID=4533 RepID=J3NB70_ORYBR
MRDIGHRTQALLESDAKGERAPESENWRPRLRLRVSAKGNERNRSAKSHVDQVSGRTALWGPTVRTRSAFSNPVK